MAFPKGKPHPNIGPLIEASRRPRGPRTLAYILKIASKYKATKKPTSQEIAWAAGFYEGEGWCTCSKDPYLNVCAQIGQKQKWPIEQIVSLFGGRMRERRNSPTPWQWTVQGPRAVGFLMTIYKFLSPRRKEQVYPLLKTWREYDGIEQK